MASLLAALALASGLAFADGGSAGLDTEPAIVDRSLLSKLSFHLIQRGTLLQLADAGTLVCVSDVVDEDEIPEFAACLEAELILPQEGVSAAVLRYAIGDLAIETEDELYVVSPSGVLKEATLKGRDLDPADPDTLKRWEAMARRALAYPQRKA